MALKDPKVGSSRITVMSAEVSRCQMQCWALPVIGTANSRLNHWQGITFYECSIVTPGQRSRWNLVRVVSR